MILANINFALSVGLLFTAFFVLLLVANSCWEKIKKREFDEVFNLMLAVLFEYISLSYFRFLIITGHYTLVDYSKAQSNGWTVPIFLIALTCSGLTFVRVFLGQQFRVFWKLICVLVVFSVILTYLITSW